MIVIFMLIAIIIVLTAEVKRLNDVNIHPILGAFLFALLMNLMLTNLFAFCTCSILNKAFI